MKRIIFLGMVLLTSTQLFSQSISVTPGKAIIENNYVLIEFDLETGSYGQADIM